MNSAAIKPLTNVSILVTRSKHQAPKLSLTLKNLGAEIYELPVIEIQPPDSYEDLDKALRSIASYDWIIFASANAAEVVSQRLAHLQIDPGDLKKIKIAAIGPATQKILESNGLAASFSPSQFIAENLLSEFPGYPNLSGVRILWPRTNVGRNFLNETLTEAGAKVDVVTAYKTDLPVNQTEVAANLLNLLADKRIKVITLMSAQSARNLAYLLRLAVKATKPEEQVDSTVDSLIKDIIFVSIGPETSQACRSQLVEPTIEARQYTSEGLATVLVDYFQKH